MDIHSQSALLACIVSLALAVSVFLRTPRSRVLTQFAFLCLTLFAYYLGDFLHAVTASNGWLRVAIGTGSLVPAFTLAFFMEFLGFSPRSSRRGRRIAALGVVLGMGVALSPLVREAWARYLVTGWVFGGLVASFSLILSRLSGTDSRVERLRLSYLATGAGVSILFSLLDQAGDAVPLPPLGAVAVTLYLFFLWQTLQRLRLLDLNELLGKVAALSLLGLILAAIYGALVSWVGNRPGLFLFNTLIASFVILILFEPLRARVEEWVVARLFTERFQMLRQLTALRGRVAGMIDLDELAKGVLDGMHETRRVTHASLYLLSDARPGFALLDHRGPAPTPFLESAAARGLLAASQAGQKAVLRENVERRVAELRLEAPETARRHREELKRLTDTLAAMNDLHAGITVPLLGGERVIGLLNLWDERVAEAYASDEIALVLEVAERVGTVIENSKLYERMKERDRLAALGEMAAGLAHEIRNPLGAIKGAAQVLDPKGLDEESREFLGVIIEEVNRLNGVVSQFLDYARPLKQSFVPTDVNDVLTRTAKLVETGLGENPLVKLELALDPQLPKAQGDAEQLKQVFINLAQNAIQAMPTGGKLRIETRGPEDAPWRLPGVARAPDMLEVRFTDTGKGIPAEELRHIFVPFFTTKEKGTGLGLAVSQRIVKSHGGVVSVTSHVGNGTEFLLRLPALVEPRPDKLPEGTPSPDLLTSTGNIPLDVLPQEAREKRAAKKKKKAASTAT